VGGTCSPNGLVYLVYPANVSIFFILQRDPSIHDLDKIITEHLKETGALILVCILHVTHLTTVH
jgi:hypothetical protein